MSSASVWKKLYVMLWKCLVLRKRNWRMSLLEFISPLVVCFTAYRMNVLGKDIWDKNHPSSGFKHDIFPMIPVSATVLLVNNVAYTPITSSTSTIMKNFAGSILRSNQLTNTTCNIIQCNTVAELNVWLKDVTTKHVLAMGIIFSKVDETHHIYRYTLRTNAYWMTTEKILDPDLTSLLYESSAFSSVQLFIDKAILNYAHINYTGENVILGKLPLYIEDYTMESFLLYLFIVVAYAPLVVAVTRDVLQEKFTGIKELMKIMGVSSWMIWIHWFIYSMLIYIPVTIFMTLILTSIDPPVIHVSGYTVWLLLLLFTIDNIFILFAFSCLFDNSTRGTIICVSLWFVVHISSWQFIAEPSKYFLVRIVICLIPLHNFCWVIHTMTFLSNYGTTWTFKDDLAESFTGTNLSLGLSVTVFMVQTAVSILILAFLDTVNPGPFGVGKPITFLCRCCFRCLFRRKEDNVPTPKFTSISFEPPPLGTKVGIQTRMLNKEFGCFKKIVAVKNVNLDIYEGEIMVLLGHNGAGKSSTMAMITGMLTPTRGKVLADGKDINTNLSTYRESLGFCTQHNMYFQKMTVIEHLIFFGMIKGYSYSEAEEKGFQLLSLLNMTEKALSNASKLSGGMLRRMCLAMSLVGRPKVLILDEPTSGLDPENRHHIWDVILGLRGFRTVLITTHFMEEADVLGDRIAVMDSGEVVCCGSAMFLKKIYGAGYNIHVLKGKRSTEEDITNIFQDVLPRVENVAVSPNQLDFMIKDDYVSLFPALFQRLESEKKALNITGISVTCTTLEDVFLKVADKQIINSCFSEQEETSFTQIRQQTMSRHAVVERTEGLYWVLKCLQVLLWKRLLYRRKTYLSFLVKFLFCSIVIWLMMHETNFKYFVDTTDPPLVITLGMYPNSKIEVSNQSESEGVADTAIGIIKESNISLVFNPKPYLLADLIDHLSKPRLLYLEFIENNFVVLYHPKGRIHLPAIAANLVSNTLLRHAKGIGSVQVTNYPYKLLKYDKCDKTGFYRMMSPFFWLVYMSCVLTVVMIDFLPFVVEERVSGFKQQQIISGLSPITYWIAIFILDAIVYILFVSLLFLLVLAFGSDLINVSSTSMKIFGLILVLHGISGIWYVYLFSFLINNAVLSSGAFIMSNVAFGMIPAIIIYIDDIVKDYLTFLILVILFSINPNFSAVISISFISDLILDEKLCALCGLPFCEDFKKYILIFPTDENRKGILIQVIFLSSAWIFYILIIVLIELNVIGKMNRLCCKDKNIFPNESQDSDVKLEKERVMFLKDTDDIDRPLRVDGLAKQYFCGPRAVKGVNFAVERGECFGLLGVNGAGKTTTLKMLTGEIQPDFGDAVTTKFSLAQTRRKYLSRIGYCPQTDSLLRIMNARESLKIIGTIRRVPPKKLRVEIEFWLSVLGIVEHAHKPSYTYSGGTKRKLSTALALIGDPDVVFLDEPTTGVDPVSRRKLWTVVQSCQRSGQAVVLTSHSMDECEVLCTRLTIMREGELQCLGTPEYLKNKYGQGFTVLVKIMEHTNAELMKLKETFQGMFPTSFIKDEHYSLLHYHIPGTNIALSTLFTKVLSLKENHNIVEDFHASNTTLEHLFLAFAQKVERRSERASRRSNLSIF